MQTCIVIVSGGKLPINRLMANVTKYVYKDDIVFSEYGGDNLSLTWNRLIQKCQYRGASNVILLNDDIKILHNIVHLIDAMKVGPSTVYSCVSNAAPWGNYIHQEEYIYSNSTKWRTHSAAKWPQGPGGFVIGLPGTLIASTINRSGMVFNESVPWGGNEAELNQRITRQGITSTFVIVHSCFVTHMRKNSWLNRKNAWTGRKDVY